MLTLSTNDAIILLSVVTSLTGFVVAWLRTINWPEWVKFLVAVSFSGLGGALTAYASGTLLADASIFTNLALVYTSGRAFYLVAFQALGLERILLPKSALVTDARSQMGEQLSVVTNDEAKNAISNDTYSELVVTATISP